MQHPLKKGDMQLVEAQKCVKPWVAIQRVQRNPQIDDQFTRPWTQIREVYTASSVYKLLCRSSIRFAPAEQICKCQAPLMQNFQLLVGPNTESGLLTAVFAMVFRIAPLHATFACKVKT
jgi:hypothetical protein